MSEGGGSALRWRRNRCAAARGHEQLACLRSPTAPLAVARGRRPAPARGPPLGRGPLRARGPPAPRARSVQFSPVPCSSNQLSPSHLRSAVQLGLSSRPRNRLGGLGNGRGSLRRSAQRRFGSSAPAPPRLSLPPRGRRRGGGRRSVTESPQAPRLHFAQLKTPLPVEYELNTS